jgi:hypothetical protein
MKIKNYTIENLKQIGNSGQKIVIFGRGVVGKLALYALTNLGLKVDYFIDSNEKLQNSHYFDIPTIAPSALKKIDPDAHVFIAHNYLISAENTLINLGIKNYYTCTELWKKTDFKTKNESIDLNLPMLKIERMIEIHHFSYLKALGLEQNTLNVKHIDIMVTERCSMKCKDCANLMQYYHKPANSEFETLSKSIDRFMECVDMVYEFRVLGGDPFMNKEMYKTVNKLSSLEKVKSVVIYTNATILPKNENFSCLKHEKVRLQITNYGSELSRKHDELVNLLIENKIKYVTERVKKWDDIGVLKHEEKNENQLNKLFMDCCANDLFTILNGKLYKCPVSANGTNLNAFPYHEDIDGINLVDDNIEMSDLKIKLRMFYNNNKYVTACNYCKGRGYGDGEIEAAIQTKKPLPLFV